MNIPELWPALLAVVAAAMLVGRPDLGDPAVAFEACACKAERAVVTSRSDAARRRHRGDCGNARGRGIIIACADASSFEYPDRGLRARCSSRSWASPTTSNRSRSRRRLMLQAVAVGAILFAAPGDLRIVPAFPFWIERGLILLAGLWFVNLVNFMDGLDWMTVAEVVPITGAMIMLGSLGDFPVPATIVAAALFGAMLGFRALQPPGGKDLSRRRRQPADRPAARLVPVAAGLASAVRRGAAAAAILSGGRDRDAVAPDG